MKMTPAQARMFWKALMDNATALIHDAHILLHAGSHARAHSLTVLAQEELGKALWLYEVFSESWNTGNETPRVVSKLGKGTNHVAKYMESFVFGHNLAAFWGDYSSYEDGGDTEEEWDQHVGRRKHQAGQAAAQANLEKKRGFYVDIDPHTGTIFSPSDIDAGTIADDVEHAAQVVEMLLITDHSRMKHFAQTTYDSTHIQQRRLLPISHPQDWEAAAEAYPRHDHLSPPDDR